MAVGLVARLSSPALFGSVAVRLGAYLATVSSRGRLELTAAQIVAHDDQRDLGPDGWSRLASAYREVFVGASRLLDAGGGSGTTVPALRTAARHVVILDWSLTMLAAAEHERSAARCVGDMQRMPFPDGTFHGVHAAYAIQNVQEWRTAVGECVRVSRPRAAVVVVWGGTAADERLAALERAYFDAVGAAAGVRAEHNGLTLEAANDLFAELGRPLQSTFRVEGAQWRTPRQVIQRVAANPYRSQPTPAVRAAAEATALDWARREIGDCDTPLPFKVVRAHHVYRAG